MESCKVNLKENNNSYEILIGESLLDSLPSDLTTNKLANSYAIITDSNIEKLYGKKLLVSLKKQGLKAYLISIPAGEASKNRKKKEKIEDKLLSLGLGRDACIISLGGGVVGDLAGFVAATYLRGVPYIQIPTSLLAMVDSSIGGKVAVNTKEAKNVIGLFYHPKRVIIDLNLLNTLPEDELRNGLIEIIKHALIKDKKLLYFIEKNLKKILIKDIRPLNHIIKRSCEIKSQIVMQDEKEKSVRKILNYGHTIGHAIESSLKYKISHGQAIAIGMSYAAKLSARKGFLKEGSVIRQNNLLQKAGVPCKLSHHDLNPSSILEHLKYDKKIVGEKINFVILREIGDAFVSDEITIEDIGQVLRG